jgi:hypothetical protein
MSEDYRFEIEALSLIDIDNINKGSIITAETLTQIFGTTPEYRLYKTEQRRFVRWVGKQLRARGKPAIVRRYRDEVRVLTDSEAIDYSNRCFNKCVRSMLDIFRSGCAVDVEELSYTEGAKLTQMREAYRETVKKWNSEHPENPYTGPDPFLAENGPK